ncbi:MAG: hypothetical protein HY908_33185 [Myxococcales bacterium]|nr:hypothetical protein [Myxococcales bacterium]
MTTLASLLLKTGAVSVPEYEAALRRQSLHGGDIGTSLLELGVLSELGLLSVLVEHTGLPAGPVGRLPAPAGELGVACPPRLARRHCVFPLALDASAIELATAAPLDPQTAAELARGAGRSGVRSVVVTAIRLQEALWRHCGAAVDERLQRVIEVVDGGLPSVEPPASAPGEDEAGIDVAASLAEEALGMPAAALPLEPEPAAEWASEAAPVEAPPAEPAPGGEPATETSAVIDLTAEAEVVEEPPAGPPSRPPYRRMSEHPLGVVVSARQPSLLRTPAGLELEAGAAAAGAAPFSDSAAAGPDAGPLSEPAAAAPDAAPLSDSAAAVPDAGPLSEPATAAPDQAPHEPATRRVHEAPAPEATVIAVELPPTPLPADDAPPSLRTALGGAEGAAAHRVVFRHRGPLTREQADAAIAEAADPRLLPEVFVYYARQFFERVALLVVQGQGEAAEVRTAHGVPGAVGALRLGLGDDGRLSVAAKSGALFVGALRPTGSDGELLAALGHAADGPALRAAILPVRVRGRVVAMLYADDAPDDVDGEAVAEAASVAQAAGAAMAALIVKKKARRS